MDVKTLCLGVLTLGDMTGYEIKKRFEEAFSHFFVAGFGSIYPALNDLTAESAVICTDVTQARRPDKKVYRITEKGRSTLLLSLMATAPRHKVRSEFMVLMYFAHLLPLDRLGQVIDERIEDIEALLQHIETFASCEGPTEGQRLCAGLGQVSLKAQLDFLRGHRSRLLESGRPETADLANST